MWTESGVEHMLVYIYDESGAPIGLQYRTSAYGVEEFDSFFFEKNLQGDIVAIYNENGVKIGQYQYDAWGNHSAKHFTTKLLDHRILYNYNPFRYRGYYYDLETGFYYLQSRYYNPEWCRFLNADVYISTGQGLIGNNMYAYCNNNPIMNIDPTGRSFVAATIGGVALWKLLVATGVVAIGAYAVSEAINNTGTTPTGEYLKRGIENLRLRIAIVQAYANAKIEEKDIATTAPQSDSGKTYYHVTTPESAAAIMSTGIMKGGTSEGGYIYAWKLKPNKYAVENSGAHIGVIISFETNTAFVSDTGIIDPFVKRFLPVVSARPGSIAVKNVKIVEVLK